MSGDTQIGLGALEHTNHGLDVKAIDSQARTRRVPWLVGGVVQCAEEAGSAPSHGDVGLVIEALKKFAGVAHGVKVLDNAIATRRKRLLQGLSGTKMARSR